MGGGDLNSKKSWHPSTIKNQERVWKAEQAAALEQKRITELRKERTEEKERSELNDMVKRRAGTSSDSRLNWMYDKPDKEAQSEDYLLGKEIEKSYGNENKTEENAIPAVARRVVGSSMIASSTDTQQVDLARKLREDPLLLVKERERAARAALLNNPLHRRRIAELLRKEQEQKKNKVKTNKKGKKKDKDLDNVLAAKLSAFGDVKGADIAKLLASEDSSSDSDDSDLNHKKKKQKKKHKNKKSKKEAKKHSKSKEKSKHVSESTESEEETQSSRKHRSERSTFDKYDGKKSETRKRKSSSCDRDEKIKEKKEKESDIGYKKRRRYSSDINEREERKNNRSNDRREERHKEERVDKERKYVEQKKKTSLSAEEKASRLAAMAAAGAQREVERGRRVAEQRRDADRPSVNSGPRTAREAHALPDSLEARIHSNRHYIQRGRHHMSENFAKR